MEHQKANLQNWKKTEAKEMVKKGTSKREKHWNNMDLSICIFPGKKQKNKIKANKKQIEKGKINANGPVHFFPFLTFLFFPLIFLLFASVFFGFC